MASNNDDNAVEKRTSKGKQKIEIKKIEKKSARRVAFSKRRKGLYEKLSKICDGEEGSEYAVITFSETGKLYVSSKPSVDTVIEHYDHWLDTLINHMGLDELERFEIALEGLKKQAVSRIDQINHANDSNLGVQETNPGNVSSAETNPANTKEITLLGHTIKVGGFNDARNGAQFSQHSHEIGQSINDGSSSSNPGVQETDE